MNENIAVKDNKKITTVGIIITAIVILSSILIYNSVIKPQKYSEYLNLGNKYLLEQNYEEAILAFEKAIKIDEKSTDARLGVAKAYIGINDIDSAISNLKEAQNLDIENEKLLIEILNILKNVDSKTLYEMLEIYINNIGEQNISDEIRDISNEANAKPVELVVNPSPGTYINPITVEFDINNIKFGHEYYYTTDGSMPNRNSQKYMNNIKINKNTQINIIGYNAKGESTDVYEMKYIIDDTSKNQLNELVVKANSLLSNTQEGTKVGNCKPGSKDNLKNVIQEIEIQLKDNLLSYNHVNKLKIQLESAIDIFNKNIIKDNEIEKKIMNKGWIGTYKNIISITEKDIFLNSGFHEGIYYNIIDKSIEENRINYKASDGSKIHNISIIMNGSNSINIISSSNSIGGTYTATSKNKVIEIAHGEENDTYSDFEYEEYQCVTKKNKYDYYDFGRYGISRADVQNYCRNNCNR